MELPQINVVEEQLLIFNHKFPKTRKIHLFFAKNGVEVNLKFVSCALFYSFFKNFDSLFACIVILSLRRSN